MKSLRWFCELSPALWSKVYRYDYLGPWNGSRNKLWNFKVGSRNFSWVTQTVPWPENLIDETLIFRWWSYTTVEPGWSRIQTYSGKLILFSCTKYTEQELSFCVYVCVSMCVWGCVSLFVCIFSMLSERFCKLLWGLALNLSDDFMQAAKGKSINSISSYNTNKL